MEKSGSSALPAAIRKAIQTMKDSPMLRRGAIVSAFAAMLAMPLAGCGIRGPLYMPNVPPAQTPPAVADPGLGKPDAPGAVVPARPMADPTTAAPVPVEPAHGSSAPSAR